jgi:hypothetical protein
MENGKRNRLRRKEASIHLAEAHNLSRAPSTLAKLAVIGGGPPMVYFGRVPFYPVTELDNWAISQISPLCSSTSERAYSLLPQVHIIHERGGNEDQPLRKRRGGE